MSEQPTGDQLIWSLLRDSLNWLVLSRSGGSVTICSVWLSGSDAVGSEVRGLGFSRGSESVNMSVHLYSLDAFEEKTLDVITFHQPAVVNKVNSSSLWDVTERTRLFDLTLVTSWIIFLVWYFISVGRCLIGFLSRRQISIIVFVQFSHSLY